MLFNTWLICEKVPNVKECWTKLLLKNATDTLNVNNWRPVTIGNLLLRIYCKILAKRLNIRIPWNEHQKAFRPNTNTGCNVVLLDSILSHHWDKNREVHLVLLDLAKAFDSISHHSVIRALRRFSVPESFISIVTDLYQDATTKLGFEKDNLCQKVNIKKGVKQGCPLSPVLFNLVLDELFDNIDFLGIGATTNNPDIETLPCLGFADDVALIADTMAGMNLLLRETKRFFDERSLKINPAKCSSVSIMLKYQGKISSLVVFV